MYGNLSVCLSMYITQLDHQNNHGKDLPTLLNTVKNHMKTLMYLHSEGKYLLLNVCVFSINHLVFIELHR